MRLGIRGKQIAAITALMGLAVVALSALYVTRLANLALIESHSRAELLARALLHHAGVVVVPRHGADPADPYAAMRDDPGIRSILESSIYGGLVDAAILDPRGIVVAHSDPTLVGRLHRERSDFTTLKDASPLEQLRTIYSTEGQAFELHEEMLLATPEGEEAFGSIRIGVSTLLIRSSLSEWLQPVVATTAGALLISVVVAALLAQLVLRPIHVIRSGLTRLGRGEFGVTLDLPPGDEFGELGSFFNTISAQLSADRSLLAGQKAHLQSAVEHLEDAVALFNPAGELLFVNPAMQQMVPAGAVGRALEGLLPTGHPFRTLVEETLAGRTSRGPMQVNVSRLAPGGEPSGTGDKAPDLLAMTHAIAGTSGELVGVLLLARDIAYLSRVQSTLAYSRKLVALGRLTAGIAHEVKNPLNAMMIHLELLRTKIRGGALAVAPQPQAVAAGGPLGLAAAPPPPPAIKGVLQHVEIIESEVRRLDEVVQGFLKFTRPEDLRLQPVRIAALLDEMLPVVHPEARKHHVRVVIDCPPDLPSVNGDAAMLRQALLNLAINACQAMPQGGTLRFACSTAPRHRVEVRIEDTGVGIAPEHLGRIFDLYFTTKQHGTGIGLSMVYRIVQLHDAEIEVESTPGRGTTFRLLLPRASASEI
jgi:signal transduction histidine kinase